LFGNSPKLAIKISPSSNASLYNVVNIIIKKLTTVIFTR